MAAAPADRLRVDAMNVTARFLDARDDITLVRLRLRNRMRTLEDAEDVHLLEGALTKLAAVHDLLRDYNAKMEEIHQALIGK